MEIQHIGHEPFVLIITDGHLTLKSGDSGYLKEFISLKKEFYVSICARCPVCSKIGQIQEFCTHCGTLID